MSSSSSSSTSQTDVDSFNMKHSRPSSFYVKAEGLPVELLAQVPPTIPAQRDAARPRSRNIVLCLDGTGDRFDNDNSNVVHLFSALRKEDPTQMCYYATGIGTTTEAGRIKSGFSAAADMAVGSSLGVHIRDAYKFLMMNYQTGDRINLFGFSRGAYTARALAAMLHKVGLLPAHNSEQVPFAYAMFKDDTPEGWKMSASFKKTYSIDVQIHFLGLWDTVASVGFFPRVLPFSKDENNSVRFVRHAVALDERRAKFKASEWFQRAQDRDTQEAEEKLFSASSNVAVSGGGTANGTGMITDAKLQQYKEQLLAKENFRKSVSSSTGFTNGWDNYSVSRSTSSNGPPRSILSDEPLSIGDNTSAEPERVLKETQTTAPAPRDTRRKSIPFTKKQTGSDVAAATARPPAPTRRNSKEVRQLELRKMFEKEELDNFGDEGGATDVLEVYFAGGHADVGGGAQKNDVRHKLSHIPLRWMIRQAFLCNSGILFKSEMLAELGLDVQTLWPMYVPRAMPICGPPPSAMDKYAAGTLPTVLQRARTMRRLSASASLNGSATLRLSGGGAGALGLAPPDEEDLPTFAAGTVGLVSPGEQNQNPTADWTPEDHEDYWDAQQPICDMLASPSGWTVLEYWPIKVREQARDGTYVKKVVLNKGRYRTIRSPQPKFHISIRHRQEALGYKVNNPISDKAQIEWVV